MVFSQGVTQTTTILLFLPLLRAAVFLVREGDNVTLSCDKTGNLVWDKEGSPPIAMGGSLAGDPDRYDLMIQNGTQMLTIKNASLVDSGPYRCYQIFTTDYNNYDVQVQVPPKEFYVETDKENVNENELATIRCKSIDSRPSPNVTWVRHNADGSTSVIQDALETVMESDQGTQSKTSEISVYADRRAYGARFYCTADIKTSALEYHNVVSTNITVKLAPRHTTLSGVNATSIEDDVVQLVCSADDAIPAAHITWMWNSDPVEGSMTSQQNKNGTYDVSSLLEFTANANYDGDIFVCIIANDVILEKFGSPIQLQGMLTVHFAPKFDQLGSGDRKAVEGGSFDLSCPVRANPHPESARWLHNSVYVANSLRRWVRGPFNDTTLTVYNVTCSDEGIYTCEAVNEVGTRTSEDMKVEVQFAPVCRPQQKYKFACAINSSIEISCFVAAHPRDNVIFGWNISGSWEITSGKLEPSSADGAYSVLSYEVGSDADYRSIQCRASNGVLEMKETCSLHILPPGSANRPNDCKVRNVTSSYVNIACWEDFDGGSTTWYSLQTQIGGEFHQLLRQTSLNFEWTNVTHNSTYTLRICAKNEEFGQSESCTSSFIVPTPPDKDFSPVTDGPPENISNATAAYIALAVVCSLVVFAVIVAGTLIVITRKSNQATSNDERSNSPGHVNAGLEATGHMDEVLRHEEGKAGGEGVSHVDDMGGDPIYDRADSMTSAIALQDIAMSN